MKKELLCKIAVILIAAALLIFACFRIVRQNRKEYVKELIEKPIEEFTGEPIRELTEGSIGEITEEPIEFTEELSQASISEDGEIYVTYPNYTEEAVAEGHFTGGFDLKMVLLGFRDKLDKGDYDADISLNKEADFVLWQDAESRDIHAVMKSKDGKQYAIVTVGDAGIDRFPTLRQVHSFRIIAAEKLDSFTENWTAYGAAARPKEETEPSGITGSSSTIKAEEGEIILYNANNKNNRIMLEGEDKALVESLLDKLSLTEDSGTGMLRYVIKTGDCKYLFDWTGDGIKDVYDDGMTLLGINLSQEDLELLKELCVIYGIYEE